MLMTLYELPQPSGRPRSEVGLWGRRVGVVLWCSFLAASVASVLAFAFIDPMQLVDGDVPAWWTNRRTVYTVGFFFFWLIALVSAATTLFMSCTERRR